VLNIGLVGCGFISAIYLENLRRFENVAVRAVADLIPERARQRAKQYGVPIVCGVDEMLADPDIQIVLNLTTPHAHADIALRAVAAGKSVYNEKPLTIARADARRLLDRAREQGVLVGCAPDTVLGAGLQTCRRLIDDGAIGEPVAALAMMRAHGWESWHPEPDFYYQPGGGPVFDMGPYYLTALAALIGPVASVVGSARASFPTRTITSQPRAGQTIDVRVPTHVAGNLEFAGGAIGTLMLTFDVWAGGEALLEIYGSEATLGLPDPNTFGGPVRIRRAGRRDWEDLPLTHAAHAGNSRGLGVADLTSAIEHGRSPRANGELAYHVLDIMHALHEAAAEGRRVPLTSTAERPPPMPADLPDWAVD
jgi:predicted dehydrogenase